MVEGLLPAMIAMGTLWAQATQNSSQNLPVIEGADRPQVAIIQYESGRILLAREVGGTLQVVELTNANAQTLVDYLLLEEYFDEHPEVPHSPQANSAEHLQQLREVPFFFEPHWYEPIINVDPPQDASPTGRATERAQQQAAEKSQQVKERRKSQNTQGTVNRAGQPYPLTAAEKEQEDILRRLERQSGSSVDARFYSLGGGLEHYRQQELAARRELALLTYDVLLEEGLRYFHARQYGQAARSLVAATQKDHGDAGSRLHAAQALLAVGLYTQATAHARRAFELSPQLIYRPLNHRAGYRHPEDFDQHIERLKLHVASHPNDDAAALLLAYELLFGDSPNKAIPALKRIRPLVAKDTFAAKLINAAKPLTGNTRE